MAPTENSLGRLVGKINWRINEVDGEFISRSTVQSFVQAQPGLLLNHGNDYLNYQDDWYATAKANVPYDKYWKVTDNSCAAEGDPAKLHTPAVRSARAQELRKQQKFLLKLHHMQQMALLERQRLELVEMSERMAAFPKPTGADLATPGIPPVQKEQKDRKSKAQDPWSWEDGVVTTVMIRGIPRHWTQQTLLKTVADEGFEEQVDFLYVPLDGKQREAKANVGYGFVNFHDAELALKFRNSFDGRVLHHHTPRNKAAEMGFEEQLTLLARTTVSKIDKEEKVIMDAARRLEKKTEDGAGRLTETDE
eukprot:g16359.t2